MSKANFIWIFGFFIAVTIITFQLTFGNLRLQDISRSTKEREAVYSMVEQYALDAMEKYLYTKYKVEGVALIEPGKEGDVEAYVASQLASWDSIKSDVENLSLSNVSVHPGSYHTESAGSGMGQKVAQSDHELPRYRARLSGDVKRLVCYAGDSPTLHFEIDIDVVAEHVGRESGYINP